MLCLLQLVIFKPDENIEKLLPNNYKKLGHLISHVLQICVISISDNVKTYFATSFAIMCRGGYNFFHGYWISYGLFSFGHLLSKKQDHGVYFKC